MKASEQTIQKIERTIRKIGQKFPSTDEPTILTDIHLRVSQESGEMLACDDDDNEITRCVIDEWIDNKEDGFYENVTTILRQTLKRLGKVIDNYGLLQPFSLVLEDDDHDNIAELYISDGDTIIINGELMKDLDKDLDKFFEGLMKDL
ncbi:MAG: hypothetical protein IKQ77_10165 [Prevotella sp.]|jgi:hypothetical protein|nr:hypothetical protein [Prevotella sp.]